ncbi:hypothetical protein [Chitinophaga rhizophila]|uniref:Uncharacterized protein n=1 Tax=Chitinophaga rhizophila TaxID=2866212 RepID=A0ABS7G762_9BACT|nr:hypothetical protein [Chitinophaga rhizophila]MBW8683469.1 hypothetical protein [Chitinophaga rhizophila]
MIKAKTLIFFIGAFSVCCITLGYKLTKRSEYYFKPGTTTLINGSIYYLSTTCIPDYYETTIGTPKLFYRSNTIIFGRCVLIYPTTTFATMGDTASKRR